jgi:hypothetical protein
MISAADDEIAMLISFKPFATPRQAPCRTWPKDDITVPSAQHLPDWRARGAGH